MGPEAGSEAGPGPGSWSWIWVLDLVIPGPWIPDISDLSIFQIYSVATAVSTEYI